MTNKHQQPPPHARRAWLPITVAGITAASVVAGVLVVGAFGAPGDQGHATVEESKSDAVTDSARSALPGPRLALHEDRDAGTSRSNERSPAPVEPAVPSVERQLWTTAPLNLRHAPRERARTESVFPERKRIGVTGERRKGYAQVVVDQSVRWVTASYLSRTKPPATGADAPLNTAPCANGVSASGGLQPAAQNVMNAVCNAFPEITTYGGAAGRGEHGGGLAIDIMVSGARGQELKQFLHANSGRLGLSNIIHARTIWSAARSSEGFRGMEDRGSTTQNHYDHVHVLVG